MAIVRSSGKFPGAGVYTVPEIFHRAGEFVMLSFYSIYSNQRDSYSFASLPTQVFPLS